jgi:hypothetical protein
VDRERTGKKKEKKGAGVERYLSRERECIWIRCDYEFFDQINLFNLTV